MQRAFCAIAVLALAILLLRAARVGLAGDYVDPVSKVTAQDEALYANSSIHMARQGGWLTPMFMGRFALYKPPLLMWVSAVSARVLGVSRLSLRLPVALFCSLAVGLVFLWAAEVRSWPAGVCAALLVVSSHAWHVLGGMAMTDGLLAAFFAAAMYALFADPWLESRLALWVFAASAAAAILTKGIAGVLPLGALALYFLAAPRKYRPTLRRACLAVGLALALALPWFAYQAAVHASWFWAEHVGVEIMAFGAGAPPQTSHENHALFYFGRMAIIDPVLTAVTLVSIPGFLAQLRRRSAPAALLACWIATVLVAILGWQYRNISYPLPMIPAAAILAASCGPFSSGRQASWMLVFAAVAFAAKAAVPSAPWGISFADRSVQPVAPLLSDYCDRARAHELIVVGLDDDLYGATLPLAKLRYALIDESSAPNAASAQYSMPFDYLGITLTVPRFNDLPRWEPLFRQRLRQWGLNSAEPIGTLVVARSPEDLLRMIQAHPASDFLIPAQWRMVAAPAASPSHVLVEAAPAHFFLLSREPRPPTAAPAWSCRL